MPKPPDDTRVFFPHRGATDRTPYVQTPGDSAPFGTLLNVRPTGALSGGRFRGGQRPGLRQKTDANDNDWGRIGNGPIQRILGASLTSPVVNYTVGDRSITHRSAWSRTDNGNDNNLFILAGTTSEPYQVQALIVPVDNITMTGGRNIAGLCWVSTTKLFGAVNQGTWTATQTGQNYLFDTVIDRDGDDNVDGFYGDTYDDLSPDAARDGYTRQNWTTTGTFTDTPYPDIAYSALSVLGGNPLFAQQPAEAVACATVGGTAYLFASVSKLPTVTPETAENRTFGLMGAYVESTRNILVNGGFLNPRAVVSGGSHAVTGFEGAYEVTGIRVAELNDVQYLYFCFRAGIQAESGVGRISLTNIATAGLTQNVIDNPGSGVFTVDGGNFGSGNYSSNYPRGHYPTGLDVDTADGSVYYTCASAGYGWDGTNPAHFPDADDSTPVTVCKVDPNPNSATYGFVWEVATDVNTTSETPEYRATHPELYWCEHDDDLVFVGGRTVRASGKNVFALDQATGGQVWSWHSSTAAADSVFAAVIDPVDRNLIVCGDRTNTWSGNDSTYANVWKIDRVTGETMWHKDVGAGVDALCMAMNETTGLLAVGTNHT